MDQSDIFDYFVDAVTALTDQPGGLSALAKLADYSLDPDWFMAGPSQDDVIDRVALVIYSKYFDSGAADDWGPNTYAQWYVKGALDAINGRPASADHIVH